MGRSKKAKGSGSRGPERGGVTAGGRAGAAGSGLPTGVWLAGLALLLVAAGAALALSMQELSANFKLPGCGESSGCADIKNAEVFGVKVGMVPVVGWPVSYVGFAFFAAMVAAWGMSGGSVGGAGGSVGGRGPGRFVTGMAFAGGVVSVLFLVAMVIAQKFCVYCFTAHVANLLFVALVGGWVVRAGGGEGARAGSGGAGARGLAPVVAGVGLFVVSAAALGLLDANAAEKAEAARAQQRAESRQAILDRAREAGGKGEAGGETGAALEQMIGVTPVDRGGTEEASASSPVEGRFAGRWEMGPEKAPIRIVIFSDYQCDLCRATERALIPMVERSGDIWLSVKHFPWCTDCNRYVSQTPHPNACWAARAAETAGALGGPEAFWKMHTWLFERQGRFETTDVLRQGIAAAGIADEAAFFAHFNDAERSLAEVKGDIEEAFALGITQTPMVFINGVEVRGMSQVSQLVAEIEALRKENLPALTAAADRPPTAAQKYADLWAQGRDFTGEETLTVSEGEWSMGADAPDIEIVMWADYKFKGVPAFDRLLRELTAEEAGIRYTFRFYPLERGCNEYLPEKPLILEGACRAAQLAEAAGQIGGREGFWKMHGWLMDNSERALGDFMAKFAAKQAGLDGDAVVARAGDASVASAIAEDAMKKQALDAGNRMPLIIVNGRVVPVSRPEGAKELMREVVRRARE